MWLSGRVIDDEVDEDLHEEEKLQMIVQTEIIHEIYMMVNVMLQSNQDEIMDDDETEKKK